MATILYAEDDDSMRRFFAAALEKAGHHVVACDDGDRALRALQFALCSIVLSACVTTLFRSTFNANKV